MERAICLTAEQGIISRLDMASVRTHYAKKLLHVPKMQKSTDIRIR